jgi:hypothetical protein
MEIRHGVMPRGESWSLVSASLSQVETLSKQLGLVATVAQIERTRRMVSGDEGGFDLDSFGRALMEVNVRLIDELEARKIYTIESDRAQYLESSQFPGVVCDRFPDAAFDMDEAARCFAFERPTACVYHLMRVSEYGLQGIGKKLGMKDERPNWEPIIAKIDSELKKPYKERQYEGMSEFLAHASAHLNAVKIAWRNRVMHVDRKHTVEEAREIYQATIGLMRYIAENLPNERGIVESIRGIIKS